MYKRLSSISKEFAHNSETWVRSLGQEEPLEKETATHSIILAGEFHGQRSMVGYRPWGHKELDTTELLSLIFTFNVFKIQPHYSRTSFPFIMIIFHCMHIPNFDYWLCLSKGGHLVCFHFLAIVNSAVWTLVYKQPFESLLSILLSSGIHGSCFYGVQAHTACPTTGQ